VDKGIWERIKNITCDELITAINKDGFKQEGKQGATIGFRHTDGRRVVIHYHPKKTYGAKLLKNLIKDIGWTNRDLKRLDLI